MNAGAQHIIGTITSAWTSQDGVVHAIVRTDTRQDLSGPLTAHGNNPADLIGFRARLIDGLWILSGRAEA